MNERIQSPPPSALVRAEAATWVAWLHGANRTPAMQAGFKRWLEMDPAHAEAFEWATEAWELGGAVVGGMAAPVRVGSSESTGHGRRRIWLRPALAAAAALCMLALGTLLHLDLFAPAVVTAVGEQRMLTLEDGSRIFLNTDTRLVVEESPRERRVRLDAGEALFDVAKDPARPFVVRSGEREVVALGTSFVVRLDAQQLSVTLVEGRVAVLPAPAAQSEATNGTGKADAPGTVLTPGQRLTFARHQSPRLDTPAIEQVTAWRRGEVILDKIRLQDAAVEMNRYSPVKLVIEDAAVADIRVSGIFRAGDSVRFARAVGETYHLAVDQQGRRIMISGSVQ